MSRDELLARKKKLQRKMMGWGGVSLLALATFIYAFFFQFVPAAREYKRLVGQLQITVIRADGSREELPPIRNLIVNAGEDFLVDAFQNAVEPELIKFHGIGTSAVAVAETQTGCTTELTTQYNPDNTRATGSTVEGASTNIYRTVGTNTVDAGATIEEFCLMTNATVGSGVMWSRVLTGTITLSASDSLQTTYDLTVE